MCQAGYLSYSVYMLPEHAEDQGIAIAIIQRAVHAYDATIGAKLHIAWEGTGQGGCGFACKV